MSDTLKRFGTMSNEEVTKLFVAWVRTERSAEAELLELLGEVDARHIYMEEAAPSLYQWLRERFNFSEAGAYRRITVARKGRDYPALIAAIRDGRLHLTGASLLAAHLNRENCEELLARAARKSKAAIEEMLAMRFPGSMPRVPAHDCVKFMRRQGISGFTMTDDEGGGDGAGGVGGEDGEGRIDGTLGGMDRAIEADGDGVGRESRCGTVSEDGVVAMEMNPAAGGATAGNPAVRLCVTIDHDTYKTLVKLEELNPGKSKGELIGRALELMRAKCDPEVRVQKTLAHIEAVAERKLERTGVQRKALPRATKAVVWKRDGGRCTFRDAGGQRCTERRRLEFDHIVPVAAGGKDTPDNLRLRCRLHNKLAAIESFGRGWMSQWTRVAGMGGPAGKAYTG